MANATWAAPEPPPEHGAGEWLPTLDIPEPGRQRRLTVLLRHLLLIPQYVVVWALSVVAFFVVVAAWFGALVLGRMPVATVGYLAGYLAYQTRVASSSMLLVDSYPPFALFLPVDHLVQVEVRPGALNRLAVFFRLLLMIPAAIVQALAVGGWTVLSFFVWLVVLVLGRMPRPLFEATAAVLRFSMRFGAYSLLLSSAYPKRLFGDGDRPTGPVVSATRPLVLSGAAKALLVLFLVVGLVVGGTSGGESGGMSDHDSSAAPAAAPAAPTLR
jgi:hypothetical protein